MKKDYVLLTNLTLSVTALFCLGAVALPSGVNASDHKNEVVAGVSIDYEGVGQEYRNLVLKKGVDTPIAIAKKGSYLTRSNLKGDHYQVIHDGVNSLGYSANVKVESIKGYDVVLTLSYKRKVLWGMTPFEDDGVQHVGLDTKVSSGSCTFKTKVGLNDSRSICGSMYPDVKIISTR